MPDIKFAAADVSAMRLGTSAVSKVMLGTTEVWPGLPCTQVLQEPFSNLAAWTGTSGSLAAGRNGTALQLPGSQVYRYTIPAISESDHVTVGFAYKVASLATNRHPLQLASDAGATNHTTIRVQADGSLQVLIGGSAGTSVGTSAAGLVVANTWVYIELQVRIHDTLGTAKLRVNGTQVISAGPIDTKFGGTKTVIDTVAITGTTAVVEQWDDLYLSTGVGCPFQGDHAISQPGDVLLEPFNNFTTAPWTGGDASWTIVAARTGSGASAPGSGNVIHYAIPAPSRSPYLMIGFAYRVSSLSGNRDIARFEHNSGTVNDLYLQTYPDGSLVAKLGGNAGTLLCTSATGLIPLSTFVYIEASSFLHDTLGTVTLRVNGAVVASATNVDTNSSPGGTNFDSVALMSPLAGVTNTFDDLYVTPGPAAVFKGSITL